MPTANEKLTDQAIRHAVNLLRFGNGVERDILKLLKAAEADVVATIGARLATIEERGFDIGPATTKRLNAMLAEIRGVLGPVYSKTYDELSTRLADLADVEAGIHAQALTSVLTVPATLPSPQLLRSIATERPIQGSILKSFVKGMEAGAADRIEQAVRLGMVEGESVDKIVRRITGTKAGGYRDGVAEVSRRSARSIVRTSINHVSNQAAQETWKANEKLVKGYRWVSTLDSRTTIVCAARDGQIFELGKGPVPPAHPNCRSITIAVTKSWEEMGLDRADTSPTTRASVDGQVPASKTFDGWLKGQPPEVHDTVLGATRARLWRDGKLDLNDFLRTGGNEVMSLDELRRAHPAAFAQTAKPKANTEAGDGLADIITPAPGFRSPINPAVTASTIKVMAGKDVTKALTPGLARAASDSRYSTTPEFRSVKTAQFGKISLGKGFTDEAASMVAALHPELDALADAFAIPRLRAIRTGNGNFVATMGDGVLTLNPTYINGFASTVGGKAPTSLAATVMAERDAVQLELKALRTRIEEAKVKMSALTGADKERAMHEYVDAAHAFNERRQVWLKLDKQVLKARRTDSASNKPKSEWKIGDPVKDRPFTGDAYFEGIDRARMTFFHEFGHHVHQLYGKQGSRRTHGTPPIEREIALLFRKVSSYDKLPTGYSKTNAHEWFAESFGLYMMGRKDLVDPEVAKLIERLLDEVKNGR